MPEPVSAQFRTEGEPAFPIQDKENENSASSPEGEKTNANPTQSQEGDQNSGETSKEGSGQKTGEETNFADHPRWKERETDWTKRFNDQEVRHTSELANLRAEIQKLTTASAAKPTDTAAISVDQIPDWFGGDEKAWANFVKWNNDNITKAKQEARSEALNEIETKSKEEQGLIKAATDFFQQEVTAIESDKTLNPKGLKVDRNKLLKIVLDEKLTDTEGRWNYRAGWKILQATASASKPVNDERNKVADATSSESRPETKPSSVTTSEDFINPSNRPW